jgi:tetratricopeptide (TPR) repeat protein
MLTTTEYLHLINNTFEQGKKEEALKLAEQAISIYPENGELIYYCGTVFADEGKYEEAKKIIGQAIANMSNAYPAILQLGLLHITSGDVENATKAWLGLDALDDTHPCCRLCVFSDCCTKN